MSATWSEIAAYLSDSPLAGLTLTLLAYQAGVWSFQRSGRQPWANPVLIAILLICAALHLSGIPYPEYFAGAQTIHLRRRCFFIRKKSFASPFSLNRRQYFTQYQNCSRFIRSR